MQPALSSPIPDASLAVFPVNGENSHQGFVGENPAPNRVREVCKFTVLLGMPSATHPNRIGSCCTGKERDAESGNDYFGARYYASSTGRWLSPDWSAKEEPVPYAKMEDPQTLNLYGYLRNNPLGGVDADGHQEREDPVEEAKETVKDTDEVREQVESINRREAERVAEADNLREQDSIQRVQKEDQNGWTDSNGVCHVGPPTKQDVENMQAENQEKLQNGDVAGALGGGQPSKVDNIVKTIKDNGFQVTPNEKTPGQEGNVTITNSSEPGAKLNLRVETHPLPGSGGQPVRHANVESVTPRTATTPRQVNNTHITQ